MELLVATHNEHKKEEIQQILGNDFTVKSLTDYSIHEEIVEDGDSFNANALIKANKRFDFLLLPGQRHGYSDMTEYFFWRMADYFSQYLLGDWDQPVDMVEMDREVEMKK